MGKKAEELFTANVTVENMRTGAAQTTKIQGTVGGRVERTEGMERGDTAGAITVLKQIVEQYEQEMMNAALGDETEEPGVWYEVARKTKVESLTRDGDGNYHLITTERAGASERGLAIIQKRSRERMAEDDAQYWAMKHLRAEEYNKAFPE